MHPDKAAPSFVLKQRLKNALYGGIGAGTYISGINRLRASGPGNEPALRILMYHKVNDLPGNPLAVSPRQFVRQLDFLRQRYTVIEPGQLLAAIRDRNPLPPDAVLLTFDDGYLDNYEHAYQPLRQRGMQALLFVSIDFIGTGRALPHDTRLSVPNPTLDWHHLERMTDVFTVGSHACSHRPLAGLPPAEAASEIRRSKQVLEERLGRPVWAFSFPKGSPGGFNAELEAVIADAGYVASFATTPRAVRAAELRTGQCLPRYNVEPFSSFTFARLLEGSCDAVGLKDTEIGRKVKVAFNRALRTTSA